MTVDGSTARGPLGAGPITSPSENGRGRLLRAELFRTSIPATDVAEWAAYAADDVRAPAMSLAHRRADCTLVIPDATRRPSE
jgi:hypothetical protein